MKRLINSSAVILLAAVLATACNRSGITTRKSGSIRVMDIRFVDSDTGSTPVASEITVGAPKPSPDGPLLTESPIEPSDPNRFRVRVTWVQHELIEQQVEVSIAGYEPYIASMNDIKTVDSSTSIGGHYGKTIKLRRIQQAQQAVDVNRP